MHYQCPCGRDDPCMDYPTAEDGSTAPAGPAGPATPGGSPEAPTGGPSLPDQTGSDDVPTYGDLVADTGRTDDPDEILTEAHSREWSECYALVSGGYDSVAAAYYTYYNAGFPLDGIIHIRTSIGLLETTEYVEEIAEDMGVPLYVADERPERDEYAYRIEDYGFPGANPKAHRAEWQNQKDKPLQRWLSANTGDGDTLLISGATREESEARYEKVNADGIEVKDGHLYASPIASWTGSDVKEFIDEQGIPRSDVVDKLNHSGDCLCGAYADRQIELGVIDENWPYLRTYIQSLEARVIDSARNNSMKKADYEEYILWAHGKEGQKEFDTMKGRNDTFDQWCNECEPALGPIEIGGEDRVPQTLTEAALQLDNDVIPDSETAFQDAFDVTQAIPDDSDEHPLEVLRRGYEALDDVAERLGYEDHKEMVADKHEERMDGQPAD